MSNKVLFCGPYKEASGWGQAARDYILCLNSVGIDVVPRCITMGQEGGKVVDEILSLEKGDSSDCDTVIQYILPNMMEYWGAFAKNIGMFDFETSNFKKAGWADYLNLMDEIWVPNQYLASSCLQSGVTKPVKVVHHPCNVGKYAQLYQPLDLPIPEGNFVFYTIGEFTTRKNVHAILKAFHCEFSPEEPVSLLVKTSIPGKTPLETHEIVREQCNRVKKELKLYPHIENYHEEIVITQRLSEDQLMRLHRTCDCFVSASRAEAWCIPAFDAMGMGNRPIITDGTGMDEWAKCEQGEGIGYLVDSHEAVCFGASADSMGDIYTGGEVWKEVNVLELMGCMRREYETPKPFRDRVSGRGIDKVYDFSYEVVGGKIKQLLKGD